MTKHNANIPNTIDLGSFYRTTGGQLVVAKRMHGRKYQCIYAGALEVTYGTFHRTELRIAS